jgi:hypothetical protein
MAGSSPPAPPPPSSNPPAWTPATGSPAQWTPPASTPPTTPMHAMRTLMPPVSFLFRVLGFTLLFVAALIVVSFAYPSGACFPSPGSMSSCAAGSAYETGAANAILAGHILFTLGAFLLGLGAGIKIHYGLQANPNAQKDETRFTIADRWLNGLLFLVSIWILFSLLTGATGILPAGF